MRVPKSVREVYEEYAEPAKTLLEKVDAVFSGFRLKGWHYESRVKELSSFAQKLETNRFCDERILDDLVGTTLVVPNLKALDEAEALACSHFTLVERKPRSPDFTSNAPASFEFDNLRLYLRWKETGTVPQLSCDVSSLVFELQIKTFLQHAWTIATHDLIYKGDDVQWGKSRIAYQVKAMLEHAEITISQASVLAENAAGSRSDKNTSELREWIEYVKTFPNELLPDDLVRLAENVRRVAKTLRLSIADIRASVEEATNLEKGFKRVSLSPYAMVLESVILKYGNGILNRLKEQRKEHRRPQKLFIPDEIEVDGIAEDITALLFRPTSMRR